MAELRQTASPAGAVAPTGRVQLYTDAERARRDASPWTVVQGVLAPLQFVVFLVSTVLVLRALTGSGSEQAALVSVVLKTLLLYAIMVTGAIWEHDVFGQYLFARPFFWEDVVSMGVLALHTLYLWGWSTAAWPASTLLVIALLAYLAYVINAAQFLLKLRAARREAAIVAAPLALAESR